MDTEKKFKTNQKQNKRITGNIHSTQKRKKQTVKHIRTSDMVQLVIFWMFIQLFFTMKSALQTSRLHDSSAVQLLETVVQCTMHWAYFKSWINAFKIALVFFSKAKFILNQNAPKCLYFPFVYSYLNFGNIF